MQRTEKVWLICAILAGGLCLAISYHAYLDVFLGVCYPRNTFLFRPEDIFSDFFDIFRPVQQGSPLADELAVYFPFAYIPLYPLAWMSPLDALTVVILLFVASLFHFLWIKLDFLPIRRRVLAAATMAFATYPFLFLVTRANLEMIVLLFMFGFLALFGRGRYLMAAALLACATAMKLYPGAFGVLLLHRRQYKASALTAALTVILTLAAAALFPGGVHGTAELLSNNLQGFKENYILSPNTIQFNSSYFNLIKIAIKALNGDVAAWAEGVLLPYTLMAIAIFSLMTIYVIWRENLLWKQVTLIAFAIILLPEISFDYKLIYILLPMALFVSAAPSRPADDRLYAILFGLLLIPKAYFPLGYEVTIGVVLNPLLMTVMTAHIVWVGLRHSRAPEDFAGGRGRKLEV